jgi:transposase-like protein
MIQDTKSILSYEIKDQGSRAGLYECAWCKKQFTVSIGTPFHGTKLPLWKWMKSSSAACDGQKKLTINSARLARFSIIKLRAAVKNVYHGIDGRRRKYD